jgi:hypothetical protein|tara:strand:- start:166 stop:315 length:150 start_codon:yes stop_codon:yes gene_type:complete
LCSFPVGSKKLSYLAVDEDPPLDESDDFNGDVSIARGEPERFVELEDFI